MKGVDTMTTMYMAVTPDDLELPLAFSESLKEFAEMLQEQLSV